MKKEPGRKPWSTVGEANWLALKKTVSEGIAAAKSTHDAELFVHEIFASKSFLNFPTVMLLSCIYGISKNELARQSKISATALLNWDSGEVTPHRAKVRQLLEFCWSKDIPYRISENLFWQRYNAWLAAKPRITVPEVPPPPPAPKPKEEPEKISTSAESLCEKENDWDSL